MVDVNAIGIDRAMFENWVQVNISLARGVKPTTLEFRQHRGTLNAKEIKWWTIFCATLFQYAHTLTESGIMIANVQPLGEENGKVDFLLEYSKKSILEHLGFPEEGVKFFRAKEKEYWNDHSARRRSLRARVCEARMWFLARNPTGNMDWKLGEEMERIIQDTPWYEADFKGYIDAKNADVKEQRRRAEVRRRRIENSEREKARALRGLVRRRARSEAQR
jgi:hypothetical protein